MKVIAVDVGTTSVRLAIIAFTGVDLNQTRVVASREKDISHHQDGVQFEQSSKEIWQAICECCSSCIQESGVIPDSIKGIAFSSTCSLVIFDGSSDYPRDIIMWMDHRAIEEASEVTNGSSKVLEQFGGVCSPEFSLSKLLWLRKHQPDRLASAKALFELPDWLVYQCIRGDPEECPRSLCSLTCKWGYDAVSKKHCDIIETLNPGLKLGTTAETLKPGTIAGSLSVEAAKELGLMAINHSGTSSKEDVTHLEINVATSLIDAHSGMLAMLSVPLTRYGIELTIESTFCSLAGTSSCHMLLSEAKNFTRGIWGPYKDVVLDGYNLLEAGQSLTGKLIEICIETSQQGKQLLAEGKKMKQIIQDLNEEIDVESQWESEVHMLPTFHGNRSPLANPRLRGGVYGLTAEREANLIELYVATIESIVFETRSIVEVLGIKLSAILVSGGLMKNKFYMQTLADVLGCKVVKMSLEDVDFMVMGSGLTARCAALNSPGSARLGQRGQPLNSRSIYNIEYDQLVIEINNPNKDRVPYLSKKYACYKEFVDFSQRVDKILYAQMD